MPQATGYVGPQTASAASTSTGVRQDITGSLIVSQGRSFHAEQVSRGLVYAASIPPGTGQAPGTAIGTTACMTLANAAAATVRLVLLRISVGYVSGTLGAGVLALLAHFSAGSSIVAPAGGTAIVPTNMLLGSQNVSVANCRFNNTVPAAGLQIRSIASFGASLASTAVQPWQVIDYVAGEVVVGPGQAVSAQGIAAAGSTPLITVTMAWAEELI